MNARFIGLNLQGLIDRKLDSIDWSLCRLFFLQNFQLSPNRFDVLSFIFYSKYKRKNPSYVLEVFDVLCVESLVRSSGVYLHTHLGLSRSRLCQELGDRFSCCIKNLKNTWNFWVESQSHKWEYLWLQWIKEKSSP